MAFQRETSGGTYLTSYVRTTRSEICRHRLACEWSTDRFRWSASRTGVRLEFNSLRLIRLSQNCSNLIALYFNVNSRYFIDNLTLRRLMSYIHIYGAPILDVSRSHTKTQHSR